MRRQSGAALVLALVALGVVAVCVLIAAAQLEGDQVAARHDLRHAVLDALSDAAFAEALAQLAADPAFVGRGPRPFGQGTIQSEVAPAGPTSRHVVASAEFQGWVATIVSEVDVSTGPRVLRAWRTVRPVAGRGGRE